MNNRINSNLLSRYGKVLFNNKSYIYDLYIHHHPTKSLCFWDGVFYVVFNLYLTFDDSSHVFSMLVL
jgi:hypothetical protein